jgi:hypothetical protein
MKARTRSASATGTDSSTQNNAEFVSVPLVTGDYFDSLLSPRKRAKVMRERRRYIAFHEAGHVVAAVRLGIPLKERAAELLTETQSGITHVISDTVDFDGSREARGRIEDAIVFLLAGSAATKWLEQDYQSGMGLSSGDLDRAKRLIETITDSSGANLPWDPYGWASHHAVGYVTEYHAYLRTLEYRSEHLIAVQENWELVVRIASVLLSRKYINRAEVLDLVPLAASRKRGKKANQA